MVGFCDLYLWRMSDPSTVYLIDKTLTYKEAAQIVKLWETKGEYDLMNKGHIPAWHEYAKPTIKRISKSMIGRI